MRPIHSQYLLIIYAHVMQYYIPVLIVCGTAKVDSHPRPTTGTPLRSRTARWGWKTATNTHKHVIHHRYYVFMHENILHVAQYIIRTWHPATVTRLSTAALETPLRPSDMPK